MEYTRVSRNKLVTLLFLKMVLRCKARGGKENMLVHVVYR